MKYVKNSSLGLDKHPKKYYIIYVS